MQNLKAEAGMARERQSPIGGFKSAIQENGDPRDDSEKLTATARGNGAASGRRCALRLFVGVGSPDHYRAWRVALMLPSWHAKRGSSRAMEARSSSLRSSG